MADGCLARTPAHVAVSVTGIAGPDGGSAQKPVGLVYLGVAARGEATRVHECRFGDIGRSAIRLASVREALEVVRAAIRPGLSHA
jgi:nicotinamide-nucleotide amidase